MAFWAPVCLYKLQLLSNRTMLFNMISFQMNFNENDCTWISGRIEIRNEQQEKTHAIERIKIKYNQRRYGTLLQIFGQVEVFHRDLYFFFFHYWKRIALSPVQEHRVSNFEMFAHAMIKVKYELSGSKWTDNSLKL